MTDKLAKIKSSVPKYSKFCKTVLFSSHAKALKVHGDVFQIFRRIKRGTLFLILDEKQGLNGTGYSDIFFKNFRQVA